MKEIGIRELKTHLTEIVRTVREDHVEYTITVHGQPVAVLRPLEPDALTKDYEAEAAAELAELDAITQKISAVPSSQTVREVLEQMREESAWR